MEALKHKLYLTFIRDDHYRFFLSGLGTTLLITFASFLLGTILGIALCAALRSKNRVVRKIASVVRTFFMELPTMVLLMILVYVVFGRSSLPVLWVVIFGLTLKAATYLSEIFDSALDTIASGEAEAARTLGMTRWQAFRYVVLPQTVTAALPLYQTQFTDTLEETSIVGYLAVVDLTRASEIVSSRTMDAFIGLFTIAIIYFVIGFIVKRLIRRIASPRKGGATEC
ncbi:MAG: amino acid ABC transporter permease [Lachnospiraceae bacterium]|nr:amino acid ABC transporter permease [Lachnospiraceae bacterium]